MEVQNQGGQPYLVGGVKRGRRRKMFFFSLYEYINLKKYIYTQVHYLKKTTNVNIFKFKIQQVCSFIILLGQVRLVYSIFYVRYSLYMTNREM